MNHTGLPVIGVAVLYEEVFVLREIISEIEVYNAKTLKKQPAVAVPELASPVGLAASAKCRCLYVLDRGVRRKDGDNFSVHRIDWKNDVRTWPVSGTPVGMSVPRDGCSVILTYESEGMLREYTTHGAILRKIKLLPPDTIRPFSAVQASNDVFLVSFKNVSEGVHRVCSFEDDGHVVRCYGAGLTNPATLAVKEDRLVLVTDTFRRSVLLLSPKLVFIRAIASKRVDRNGWTPQILCPDDGRERVFVAENQFDYNSETYVRGEVVQIVV